MINLTDYWMGRDKAYVKELTDDIRAAAAVTVIRTNKLISIFFAAFPASAKRKVNSGWRPAAVNGSVPGAAKKSKHMTGQAVDLSDDDGKLDQWLMTPDGQKALADCELWHEHPSATPRWCHVQTIPPRSGKRTFMP